MLRTVCALYYTRYQTLYSPSHPEVLCSLWPVRPSSFTPNTFGTLMHTNTFELHTNTFLYISTSSMCWLCHILYMGSLRQEAISCHSPPHNQSREDAQQFWGSCSDTTSGFISSDIPLSTVFCSLLGSQRCEISQKQCSSLLVFE